MGSRVFQRLHSVRQLGLAHLVYPGANYSRFSHSIGACHNAARMVDAIRRNSGKHFSDEAVQAFRLVGLLHDIGHYPFSHATEHVVKDYYVGKSLLVSNSLGGTSNEATPSKTLADPPPEETPLFYEHEDLGEQIIRHDPELNEIFSSFSISPSDIADLFSGKRPDPLFGIISSELDCDRLDYLRRTSHFSGAPYGSVDIDFIIDQATVDHEGRFCLQPKALRAADHLLVCRYYDYLQIPFNKTVAALEWSLVSTLRALLDRSAIDCSSEAILRSIRTSNWSTFDDQKIFEDFKELYRDLESSSSDDDKILRDHIFAILRRSPAKMVSSWEEIVLDKDNRLGRDKRRLAEHVVGTFCREKSINPGRVFVWVKKLPLSDVRNDVSVDSAEPDVLAKAILISGGGDGETRILNSFRQTLMHHMADRVYYGLRVYFLHGTGGDDNALTDELRKRLAEDAGWTA